MTWDLGKLHSEHERILAAHSAMVRGVLYDAGNVTIAEVVAHPGFKPRTGALQKATNTRLVRTRGGHIVRITNRKNYAAPIEHGSRPHRIVARNAKTLRFISGGHVVYRRAVNHPGNKPYRFLSSAVGVAGTRAERMLLSGMQRITSR